MDAQNIITYRIGEHSYVFPFADHEADEMALAVSRLTGSRELPFSWIEAGQIINRIKSIANATTTPTETPCLPPSKIATSPATYIPATQRFARRMSS